MKEGGILLPFSGYTQNKDVVLNVNKDSSWYLTMVETIDTDTRRILDLNERYSILLPDNLSYYSNSKPIKHSINEKHISLSHRSKDIHQSIRDGSCLKAFSRMGHGYSINKLSEGIRFWIEEIEIDKYNNEEE